MYLTRIYLNPHRRGAKQLMRSRQVLHAAVMNCFPPGALEDVGMPRVLWRLDRPSVVRGTTPRQGSPSCALYISSPVAPDPSHIVEEAGYATGGWGSRPRHEYLPRWVVGWTEVGFPPLCESDVPGEQSGQCEGTEEDSRSRHPGSTDTVGPGPCGAARVPCADFCRVRR